MNRFFSKLDLRDIKIDPEGSRFPPDADEDDQPTDEHAVDVHHQEDEHRASAQAVVEQPDQYIAQEPDPYVPVESETAGLDSYQPYEVEEQFVPVASNGHLESDQLAATVAVEPGDEILKVSAKSRPSAVAGAIAGVVREFGRAEVQAIGAGATNQAVKAAAIARDYLRESGIDAVCLPAFIDVTIDNEDRTAIRILIEPR
jgi:stage V sporulation protein S